METKSVNRPLETGVRCLPSPGDKRVESGAVQFGDDWPGLFLRGDSCLAILQAIKHMEKLMEGGDCSERLMVAPLYGLRMMIEDDVLFRRGT